MFETTQKRKRYDRQFKISAAKVVLSNEMTVRDLSEELGIKDSTLRRWPCECKEMGDNAFPGNGSLEIDKGYEIVEVRKRVEGLEHENELLKNFRAFLSRGHARGTGSSRRIGTSSVPSGAANYCLSMRPNPSDMLIVAAVAALSAGLPPATSGRFCRKRTPILPWVPHFWAVFDGVVRCRLHRPGKCRRVVVFRAGSACKPFRSCRELACAEDSASKYAFQSRRRWLRASRLLSRAR